MGKTLWPFRSAQMRRIGMKIIELYKPICVFSSFFRASFLCVFFLFVLGTFVNNRIVKLLQLQMLPSKHFGDIVGHEKTKTWLKIRIFY
jgi:hypothetical protein